jgi:hypothetical protein
MERAFTGEVLVGRGEAQLVTLVIGDNSRISIPEQLREGAQIKLVARQARALMSTSRCYRLRTGQACGSERTCGLTAHVGEGNFSERGPGGDDVVLTQVPLPAARGTEGVGTCPVSG